MVHVIQGKEGWYIFSTPLSDDYVLEFCEKSTVFGIVNFPIQGPHSNGILKCPVFFVRTHIFPVPMSVICNYYIL